MDKIDEKILTELDKNPRIHITQLAKHVRISQQVADYRIKRLLNQGVITKFGTIINLKALKQEHYRIFFTFNSKKEFQYERIFSYLKNQKGVYWAARIGGKYDLLVVLFVYDFAVLDSFIDNFNNEFPGLIKDYKSAYALDYELQKHKYLRQDSTSISYGYKDAAVDVDNLDLLILDQIKDNCRLSALEISAGKRVSYKTIINRIKGLQKNNVILGYRMFMKSQNFNPYIVLLSFKNYSKKAEDELLTYVRRHDRVTQLVRLFGIWNLFLHVRMEDNEKLQDFIIALRDKFDIIDNYEIIPIFEDIAINLLPL